MEDLLNSLVDLLFGALTPIFETRWIAPLVLAPAMFGIAIAIWIRHARRLSPHIAAAERRIIALQDALGSDPAPDAERASFAGNFDQVRAAMAGEDSQRLRSAWREFEETIVDETESPIRNTARPAVFFARALPRPTKLAFWSNIFVATGLVLTFLGIVVALNKTAGSMTGSDVAATQGALHDLLAIASVKFMTSIAGVGCSIILRFAEDGIARRVERVSDELCDLIERGLLYIPAQLLAIRQLDELRRQSTQLEKFNTDLAIQIGEQMGAQFQTALAPLATSLTNLNDNIGGMSDRLGEGVGKAVEGAASGELRALGHTLNALREQLQALTGNVQGSGEEAARQIRAAGADFSQAAQDIREAFSRLSVNVDEMGGKLTSQSEAMNVKQRQAIDQALADFATAHHEASRGLRDGLAALQDAGVQAGAELQTRLGEAMSAAAGGAEGAIKRAIDQTSAGLSAAGQDLAKGVSQAAAQMAAIARAIEAAEKGTAANADHLQRTAENARTIAGTLLQAADGFGNAAAPVAESSRALREAADRIEASSQRSEKVVGSTLQQISSLAANVAETQSAATGAWADYRQRFAEVDRELGQTISRMADALASSMAEFRNFATTIDSELGKAVNRLAPAADVMRDSAENIAEFAEVLRTQSRAAE